MRPLVPAGMTLGQFALRWILMAPEVTCAIPGGRTPVQIDENVAAADLPPLAPEVRARVREIYLTRIGPQVHDRW